MRILIVQLSDIHLAKASDVVLARGAAIVSAVRNLEPDLAACFLLLSGDVVNTGKDVEYSIAYDFVEDLKHRLGKELPKNAPVHVVLIPGNHDCDLSSSQFAREAIRSRFLTNPSSDVDETVIDVCVEPQRYFFELRDTVSDEGALKAISKVYYEYRFSIGGETVEFRCLNSSWLSQLDEVQGSLFFPPDIIPLRNAQATLAVSLLHHPFAWFESSNRRALQARLEQVSDIIFSGHEHAHTRRRQVVSTGEVNEFIEGAALQVRGDDDESSFNVLVVDTSAREQRFFRFEWGMDMYSLANRADWEVFQVNKLRARKDFAVTDEFSRFLEDPGAGFEKKGFGRPRLSQLFVFPELREVSLTLKEVSPAIRGEEVFDESISTANLLISGAEQSGKTCLAKTIFQRLRSHGSVPLYVDGSRFVPQKGARLHEQLYRLFPDQYGESDLEKFRQLETPRRAVIIDDFHKIHVRSGESETFLDSLQAFAGRVILLTNDLAHAVGEILRAGQVIEQQTSFTHFRLLPFGYAKRTELTSKWFLLPGGLDDEQLARLLTDAEERMEVVLGENFVPALPIFILAMLQGLESITSVDANASTYGHFFEILIKTALATNATKAEFDIRQSYLTRLAYHLFVTERTTITENELRTFHEKHQQLFDVRLGYSDLINELQARLILVRYADTFEFKYGYFYFYFVARHFSLNINQEETRNHILRLSKELTKGTNADILLFLVHLSGDPIIIREMVASAKLQFADAEQARLDDDVKFLAQFAKDSPDLEYEEHDVMEYRHSLAEERDRQEREEGEAGGSLTQTDYDQLQALLDRYIAGFKTLEILGQILKNFPGSLEGKVKEEIALECYRLGFRLLGSLLGMLRSGGDAIVSALVESIRERRPTENPEKAFRKASNAVFGLGILGTHGIVKRISAAVGSPELSLTYARVEKAMPTTATRLANMSIHLDTANGFPTGELIRLGELTAENPLPHAVLRWMVFGHANLFPVGFQDKQKVFSALGIKYSGTIGANPSRRLLGPGGKQE